MKNILLKISIIDKVTTPIQKMHKTFQNVQKSVTGTQRKLKVLPNSIQSLENKLTQLRHKQKQAFTVEGIRKYQKEIRKTERELTKLNKKAGLTKGSLSGMIIGGGAIYTAYNGLKSIISLSAQMEQTQVAFETMLGSTQGAKKMIDDLNQFANATPFDNTALYDNAKLLLNFGIKDADIIPTLKMLGDVSGGSKEKLDSLTLAFAQIQSQGKLTGQDLLQMINAGFNPLQEISDMTGKSMAELKDMMSKGAITSDMVTQAFQHATGEGGKFYQMMEKQSQTLAGKWSTLIGKIKLMAVQLGNKLMPVITKIIDKTSAIADWIGRNIELITTIIGVIASAIAITKAWSAAQQIAAVATKMWIAFQWLLNIAMEANPIGLIIVGVAALIGLLVLAWKKSEKFRATITGLWEAMKAFGSLLKDVILNALKSLLSSIGKMGQALWAFFKGDYKQAFEYAKQGAVDFAKGTSIGVAYDLVQNKDKVTNAFSIGYDKGVTNFRNANSNNQQTSSSPLGIMTPADIGGGNNTAVTPVVPTQPVSNSQNISSITGGGTRPTNISVTFDKLIETLSITAENVEMSIDEMETKLTEALTRVLNSAAEIAT